VTRPGRRRAAPAPARRNAPAPRLRWAPPSRTTLALLAIAAFAAVLRLLHVGHDLPYLIEEAIPLRAALENWSLAGRPDWNPHRFHYPSLVYDLHLATQMALCAAGRALGWWRSEADFLLAWITDPSPMVRLARTLHVLADAVTVFAAGRAAERLRPGAGLVAALLTAFAASLIRASRLVYTDTVMAAFAMLALERTLAWRAEGGAARLRWAAVCAGLAAGAKYPGFVLLLPLWAAIVERERRRGLPAIVVTGAIALGTFLVTTPFAVLDARTFLRDVGFLGHLASAGHLGDFDRPGFAFHLRNLAADLGVVGVVALGAALVRLAVVRRDAGAALPVAIAFAALAIPVALAKIEAERYLVPVLPFAAVLAAWGALAWCAALPAAVRRAGAVLAAAALLATPVLHGAAVARAGAWSTQVEAARWCEAHVQPAELMISELYGPPLVGHAEQAKLGSLDVVRNASTAAQERLAARRTFAFVPLPIATVGRVANPVADPAGRTEMIEVVAQGADLSGAFYDPRVLAGATWVVTSSAVRGRFAADSARFAAPMRLYALLDRTASVTARLGPHDGVDGPEIVIYRVTDATRAAFAALGPLDPLWWTEVVPADYRVRATARLRGADPTATAGVAPAPRDSSGAPAPWVRSLTPLFVSRFEGFATALAIEHQLGGRPVEAWPWACAILELDEANAGAWFTLAWSAGAQNRWSDALPLLRRGFAAQERLGEATPDARALLARAESVSPVR
jgi:hypothetical protein